MIEMSKGSPQWANRVLEESLIMIELKVPLSKTTVGDDSSPILKSKSIGWKSANG